MKGKPQMTGAQRLAARYVAQGLIAEMVPRHEIVKRVKKRWKCGDAAAERVYRLAWKDLTEADETQKAERKALVESRLEALYRKCLKAEAWAAALGVLREIKKLHGLDAPLRGVMATPTATPDALARREERELDYYLEHGHWPEEAPQEAANLPRPSKDPLDRLH